MEELLADERTKYVRINVANGGLFIDSEILALSSRVLKVQFASGLERDKYVVNLPSISLDVFKETIYAWFFKELQTGFDWTILDTLEKYEWPTLGELYRITDQYEWKFKDYISHFVELKFRSAVARLNEIRDADEFDPEYAYAIFPHMEFFLQLTDCDCGGRERLILNWLECFGGVVLPYYKTQLNKMIEAVYDTSTRLLSTHYYLSVDDDLANEPAFDLVRANIKDVREMLLKHLERFFSTVSVAVAEPLIRLMTAHSWLFDSWTAWEEYAFEDYAGTVASILLDRPKFEQKYPIYARCRKAFLGFLTADNILETLKRFRVELGNETPSTFSHYLSRYKSGAQPVQPFTKLCEDYMYCHANETVEALNRYVGPLDYDITEYFGNLRLLKRAALAQNFF